MKKKREISPLTERTEIEGIAVDGPDLWKAHDKLQRAGKPHRCDDCKAVIERRDYYVLRVPDHRKFVNSDGDDFYVPEGRYAHRCCRCAGITT